MRGGQSRPILGGLSKFREHRLDVQLRLGRRRRRGFEPPPLAFTLDCRGALDRDLIDAGEDVADRREPALRPDPPVKRQGSVPRLGLGEVARPELRRLPRHLLVRVGGFRGREQRRRFLWRHRVLRLRCRSDQPR